MRINSQILNRIIKWQILKCKFVIRLNKVHFHPRDSWILCFIANSTAEPFMCTTYSRGEASQFVTWASVYEETGVRTAAEMLVS